MIKAEIEVYGDWIKFKGFEIVCINGAWHVNNGGGFFTDFQSALEYCLEQSK